MIIEDRTPEAATARGFRRARDHVYGTFNGTTVTWGEKNGLSDLYTCYGDGFTIVAAEVPPK